MNWNRQAPQPRSYLSPLWERHRPPSAAVLEKNAEAQLRLRRIEDAIRVRGYGLSLGCNPSPQPSPIEVGYIRLRHIGMPNSGIPELGWRGSTPSLSSFNPADQALS